MVAHQVVRRVVGAARPRAAGPTGATARPAPRSASASSSVRASTSTATSGLAAAVTSAVDDERSSRPAVDDDDVVADPLQLAEQVRGDQHRDAELGADPPDQPEHVVAPGRVEAVGRLVEQDQCRVVHERLGELDPLLHAGGVAADRPVALLVEPDVAQRVGGALPGRRARAAPTSAPCARRTRSRTRRAAGSRARACSRRARGSPRPRWRRRGRARCAVPAVAGSSPSRILISVDLPAPLAPTRPTTPGSIVDGEPVDRGHLAVPLGEAVGVDQGHALDPTDGM